MKQTFWLNLNCILFYLQRRRSKFSRPFGSRHRRVRRRTFEQHRIRIADHTTDIETRKPATPTKRRVRHFLRRRRRRWKSHRSWNSSTATAERSPNRKSTDSSRSGVAKPTNRVERKDRRHLQRADRGGLPAAGWRRPTFVARSSEKTPDGSGTKKWHDQVIKCIVNKYWSKSSFSETKTF